MVHRRSTYIYRYHYSYLKQAIQYIVGANRAKTIHVNCFKTE